MSIWCTAGERLPVLREDFGLTAEGRRVHGATGSSGNHSSQRFL